MELCTEREVCEKLLKDIEFLEWYFFQRLYVVIFNLSKLKFSVMEVVTYNNLDELLKLLNTIFKIIFKPNLLRKYYISRCSQTLINMFFLTLRWLQRSSSSKALKIV